MSESKPEDFGDEPSGGCEMCDIIALGIYTLFLCAVVLVVGAFLIKVTP